MMSSTHDGEALAALRKANAMLKESKLTWAEALAQTTTAPKSNGFAAGQHYTGDVFYDDWPPPTRHRQRTPQNKWLAFASQHPDVARWLMQHNDTNDFAASLVRGVMKYGSLTERQMAAVRRHL